MYALLRFGRYMFALSAQNSKSKSPKYWTIICWDVCAVYGAGLPCYYPKPDLTCPYQKKDGEKMAGGARLPHRGRHPGGLRRRIHSHFTCTSDAIRTRHGLRYKNRVCVKIAFSKNCKTPGTVYILVMPQPFSVLGIFASYHAIFSHFFVNIQHTQ